MKPQIFDIYMITSPTGRLYIGYTQNLEERKRYYELNHCKTQTLLYRSIAKHGWENHSLQVIDSSEDGPAAERKWISYHKSNIKRNPQYRGLNLSDGGEGNPGGCIIRVYEYSIQGDYIREWDSQDEAMRYHSKKSNHIPQVCRGTQRTFANRQWRYYKADKIEPISCKKISHKYNNILQIDKEGKLIKEWSNMYQIKIHLDIACPECIIESIKENHKTYKGFYWRLKNEA